MCSDHVRDRPGVLDVARDAGGPLQSPAVTVPTQSDWAVRVQGLSKCYQIYERPHHRLLQGLFGGRRQFFSEFWALRDVGFEVRRGETFGIVGRNGSGKSTLLQMLSGTLAPTAGTVEVNGRVAALLELGAGFNPESTGRDNVYMNGRLFGLSTAQIEERFDRIAAFADIGAFLDQPVKTYSSGMYVRLAFAVVAHVDADILVVDEALSVGDAYFVQKCMRFLRSFMDRGTLLFVSHDAGAVLNLCQRALLLDRGRMQMVDTPKVVMERYLTALYEDVQGESAVAAPAAAAATPAPAEPLEYRDARADLIDRSTLRNDIEVFRFQPDAQGFGVGKVRIDSVVLLDTEGAALSWVVGGENVRLQIRCSASEPVDRPIVGFTLKDRLGQAIFGDNTFLSYRLQTPRASAGGTIVATFDFRMPVLPVGDYAFAVAIADGTQESHVQHHWIHEALIIRSQASAVTFGLIGIPMRRIELVTS